MYSIQTTKILWSCKQAPSQQCIFQIISNFNAKRPPGRPQMRWTDQIRKDTGLPLQTADRRTMDRDAWRARNSGRARGINKLISQVKFSDKNSFSLMHPFSFDKAFLKI